MKIKKLFPLLIVFILTVSCVSIPLNSALAQNVVSTEPVKIENFSATPARKKYIPNSQTYDSGNGQNTIYWTQGITPPKMTTDKKLLGTKGYFEKDVAGTFVTYQAPFEENKGYYDLNKDKSVRPSENPFCYFGSATNILHWWIDQNKQYITAYLDHLKNDDAFAQREGLKELIPFDQDMWNKILSHPTLTQGSFGLMQEIDKDPLARTALSPYYSWGDGYWMDLVWDFFINGYQAISLDSNPANNENNFTMDKRGGYFHPIFGKTPISKRFLYGKYRTYSFYNQYLAQMLNNGMGVTMSYSFSGGRLAHALTVWGAEYDQNNNLIRIFVTDTDDENTTLMDPRNPRGIHSMNVIADENDILLLTNNTDPNNKKGTILEGMMYLDLSQHIWEASLNDLTPPIMPSITTHPQGDTYALGTEGVSIYANAQSLDTGYISYQWYSSPTENGNGTLIPNATKQTYYPPLNTLGTTYYYCLISNNKNGKQANKKTNYAKFDVLDVELKDAQTPTLNFNAYKISYDQYQTPTPLVVHADISDQGTLSYQWYTTSDSSASWGNKIDGATTNTYIPQTTNVGTTFYYCEVTNSNPYATGKKMAKAKTSGKAVIINPAPLINSNLSSLTISNATLSPVFSPTTYSYIVNVKCNITKLDISANAEDSANITINNKDLQFGANTITIIVTNQNKTSTYTINVNRDNHNFGEWEITKQPTCEHDGERKRSCTNCGLTQTEVIQKLNHKYESVVTPPTCTQQGFTTHTCSLCGHSYIDSYVDALGHNFGEWEITKQPTFTEYGEKRRVCVNCGIVETMQIDKLIPPVQPEIPDNPDTPVPPPIDPEVPVEPNKPTPPVQPETPVEPNKPQEEKKGCGASLKSVSIGFSIILILSLILLIKRKKVK